MRSRFLNAGLMLACSAVALGVPGTAFAQIGDQSGPSQSGPSAVETVTVTAEKLAAARNGIQTQSRRFDLHDLRARTSRPSPAATTRCSIRSCLQAPGVAQDSFGQLHVRGEHNGLQYRLNGIIIPEGISVFGQTLDPRLAGSVQAHHRRAAGGIRLAHRRHHRHADQERRVPARRRQIGIYGGSHGTDRAERRLWRLVGRLQLLRLGRLHHQHARHRIAGRQQQSAARPHQAVSRFCLSCRTSWTRTAASRPILGTSNDMFQIPNQRGLQPRASTASSGWDRSGSGNMLSQRPDRVSER